MSNFLAEDLHLLSPVPAPCHELLQAAAPKGLPGICALTAGAARSTCWALLFLVRWQKVLPPLWGEAGSFFSPCQGVVVPIALVGLMKPWG